MNAIILLALVVVYKYCTVYNDRAEIYFASQFVPHRMEEYLNRVNRIEGSILTLSGQVFQGQSATTSVLVQMQEQIQQLKSMMSSLAMRRKRPAVPSQVSPTALFQTSTEAVPKLCAFCDASCKRCTATASLRHMLTCDQRPATSCKHFSISEHLFNYKNEPLVGPMGECCWCGNVWDNCTNSSSSQSPKSADAQSKHKKSCHVACHKALQSKDPATVDAAKAMLDRIWSNINTVVDRRIKRSRAEPIIEGVEQQPVMSFQVDGLPDFQSSLQRNDDDHSSDRDNYWLECAEEGE